MRYSKLSLLIPCALLLSACTTVTPAYKDNGPRIGACVEGGPDSVAQQFYDYRIQHHSNDIAALRPYLSDNLAKLLTDASRDTEHRQLMSGDLFSSRATLRIAPASPAHQPFRTEMRAIFLFGWR